MAAIVATSIAAQDGDHQSDQSDLSRPGRRDAELRSDLRHADPRDPAAAAERSDPHSGTAAPTVRYRMMSWDDVDAIIDLFGRTWPPEGTLAGTPSGLLVSRYFTLHYLEHTTYGIVAERDDGMFAGVILARVAGARPLYDVVPAMMARVRADLAGDAAASASLRGLDLAFDVELELEASCGVNETTQGELELFVVNPDVRGAGVGGGLWRRAQAHLAQAGVESYYLHTDSDCDVSFYDHKGMTRVAERLHAATSAGQSTAAVEAASDDMTVPWSFADDMFIYRGPVDLDALDTLTGRADTEAETALASVASLREDWHAPAAPSVDAAAACDAAQSDGDATPTAAPVDPGKRGR